MRSKFLISVFILIAGRAYAFEPPDPNLIARYFGSSYCVIQAEDDTSGVRFYTRNGKSHDDWFITADSGIVLGELSFEQSAKRTWGDEWHYIEYWRAMRMAAARDFICPTDTLAILRTFYLPDSQLTSKPVIIDSVFITADSFFNSGSDTITWNCRDYSFHKSKVKRDRYAVIFEIETLGKCPMALDWLKIWEPIGERIMEGLFDLSYADFIKGIDAPVPRPSFDDLCYDQILPCLRLDSIITANTVKNKVF